MTELIVALDLPEAIYSHELYDHLRHETEVRWFKVEEDNLLDQFGYNLIRTIARNANLFLDLKCYKTADSIDRVARRAFDLGARFLSVHATPSMLEAAMRAKPAGDRRKVLAVGSLTDDNGTFFPNHEFDCDGIICAVRTLGAWKARTADTSKILVCPGIRPIGWPADNHVNPATPAEAKAAGADYIVVGRPIINSNDPVKATWAIIDELAAAS